jgi:hypothetical protein
MPHNVPHQRLGAERLAHNRRPQACCGSRARALYANPDRCMQLLGGTGYGVLSVMSNE